MKYVIGVCGQAQVGKDSVGKILVECLQKDIALGLTKENVFLYPAAQSLKELVAESFNITPEHLEERKNNPVVRWTLEKVGTEFVEDSFIKVNLIKFISSLPDHCALVVTGVRKLSEAMVVEDYNGIMVRVRRDYDANGKLIFRPVRPSENELNHFGCDFVVQNDTSLDRLEILVRGLYVTAVQRNLRKRTI